MSKSKILKHLSDLITPKTANQKATENITKGQRTYREGQRKSGAAGVVAGAGAVAAMSDNGDKKVVKIGRAHV